MSIDFNKLKKLILLFAKLDEKYQADLLGHAYILSAQQSQKALYTQKNFDADNPYTRSSKHEERKNEYEKIIKEKANERITQIMRFFENYDQLDAQDKATLIAATNQLSGGELTKETDIEIKLSHKKIPLESLLQEMLPGADFEKAIKDADSHIIEYKKALV